MTKDKLESLGSTQATRRTVLKGLLVGLGAGVVVQATGGVTTFARGEQATGGSTGSTDKTAKKKVEKGGDIKKEDVKLDKAKTENKSDSKAKNEKKKAEEPKQQHKK